MASVPVKHATASANINGDDRPIGQVTMTLAVGGVSTCFVTSYEDNDAAGDGGAAVDALAEDVATELADQQTSLFDMPEAANSTVTINDGDNSLTFRCFPSCPSYNNSLGGTGLSHVLIHEAAILSSYRSFIYPTPIALARESSLGMDVFKGADGKGLTSTEMTTRFMEVLDILVKRWTEGNRSSANSPSGGQESVFSLVQREARHAQNLLVYPRLQQVMQGSDGAATWQELTASQGKTGLMQNAMVSNYIASLLTEKCGDFFSTLGNFGQSFHAMFVPEFPTGADRLGHFVSYGDVGGADGHYIPLSLPITNLQFSGGHRGFLPLTHVLINGGVTEQYRDGVGQGQGNLQLPIIVVYPANPNLSGLGANFPAPPWMTGTTYGDVDRKSINAVQNQLNVKDYAGVVKQVQAATGTIKTQYKKDILDRWAKNLYYFTALESASCSVQIPLDVSILPGARYSVSNMSGTLIFTGFLAQVAHRLQVQPRQGTAVTDLTFSHVCAGNFALPE